MKKFLLSGTLALMFVIGVLVTRILLTPALPVEGSVVIGGVNASSSPTNATLLPVGQTMTTLRAGRGVLSQVTITKSDTGTFTLYDATTSDATQRASSLATSTILIAHFPASPTAGTYVYDVVLNYGLLEGTTGSVSSTTVMFRGQ